MHSGDFALVQWDGDGWLESIADGTSTTTYTYERVDGLVVSATVFLPGVGDLVFEYDEHEHLVGFLDEDCTLEHDGDRLVERDCGSVEEQFDECEFEARTRVDGVEASGYTHTYGRGCVRESSMETGDLTRTYTYDELGRVIEVEGDFGFQREYTCR